MDEAGKLESREDGKSGSECGLLGNQNRRAQIAFHTLDLIKRETQDLISNFCP